MGVDETSSKKGHEYITLFWDMETKQLLNLREGRSNDTVAQYVTELRQDGKQPEKNIQHLVADMSPAFKKGFDENLPDATLTYDRFHVMQLAYRHCDKLLRRNDALARQLRDHLEQLATVYEQATPELAGAYLHFWLDQLEEHFHVPKLVASLKKHYQGIVTYAETKLTNGLVEGLNNKIQWIRRTARGFKNKRNFMRMIFFVFGHLKLPYQPISL